ncbi:MAG TPA: hypothetical protein VFQ53_17135 [Kofleriaceae bacterium]|nr:hypothetical protein [Kofleriaceae bacterium]
MWRVLVLVASLTGASACGKLLGIEDLGAASRDGGGDGGGGSGDAMPGNINFSGDLFLFSETGNQMPAGGAIVDVLEAQSGQVLGSGVADPNGHVSIDWTQPGNLDVFLFTKHPSALDTFVYFPTLQLQSTNISMTLFTPQAMQMMSSLAGVPFDANLGTVLALAETPAMGPVVGANITSNPAGKVVYADDGGNPNPMLGATTSAGFAWIFNTPTPTQVIAMAPNVGSANVQLDVPPSSVSYLSLVLK